MRLEEHARALNLKYHDRIGLLRHTKIKELFDERVKCNVILLVSIKLNDLPISGRFTMESGGHLP